MSGRLFLRLLALVYLVAFASLAAQITGLVGERGILPVGEFLDQVLGTYGSAAHYYFPTLVWFSPTDAFLTTLCWAGAVASILLLIGVVPIASALVLWILYLSLKVAGQVFLQFQWDSLLLETGLLAILYAPPVWLMRRGNDLPPPAIVRWALWGLAFKVTFLSGITKIVSGDPSWASLQALRYHYETQPLPLPTSWYMHQLPQAVQAWSAAGMFFIELVIPWTVFLPPRWRRARLIGCTLMIALQLGIAATGNYGFFNLLTIVLYLAVLDDPRSSAIVGRVPPKERANESGPAGPRRAGPVAWRLFANGTAVVIAVLSAMMFFREIDLTWGRQSVLERLWSSRVLAWVAPFDSVNGYGLFRVMTTERPEIVLEVSEDGVTWKEQEFRWKPGDLKRRPALVEPHMPRLDWQMWFAALDPPSAQDWLRTLISRLLAGEPSVGHLLGPSPLRGATRFARFAYYQYHFTSQTERTESGAWWKREFVGYLADSIPKWGGFRRVRSVIEPDPPDRYQLPLAPPPPDEPPPKSLLPLLLLDDESTLLADPPSTDELDAELDDAPMIHGIDPSGSTAPSFPVRSIPIQYGDRPTLCPIAMIKVPKISSAATHHSERNAAASASGTPPNSAPNASGPPVRVLIAVPAKKPAIATNRPRNGTTTNGAHAAG